ncbi:hypothetical protein, partial, partial [Parasitella parasitica]
MDSDNDEDIDIDMDKAEKEAAASSQTVEEVVQRMKLQIRIQRRKIRQQAKGSKAMGNKARDKAKEKAMDNVLRPRPGGISSKVKGTTIHSSLNNPRLSDSFIRYLRGQDLDIFACQETNIPSLHFDDRIAMLDMKLQSYQSIWTSKCGLFNFNRNMNMEKIHISDDDRIILAKLTVPAEPDLLPIYVLNIYAPADSPQSRTTFYNKLLDYIKSLDSYGDILDRLILAGDFNFQYDLRLPNNAPHKRPAA